MDAVKIIKKIVPQFIKDIIRNLRYRKIKNAIMSDISNNKKYEEEYSFLKNNNLEIFPYKFIKKYKWENIPIMTDENDRLYYLYRGKRMYFKKSMDADAIKKYVNGILLEQDVESPHNYNINRIINNPLIQYVADIGAAEGFFALDIIEHVQKVYVFECDDEWIEALTQTFKPYSHKIEIIKKYVGKSDSSGFVTLDSYFANLKLDCLKADIEGAEIDMLSRGGQTLSKIQLAIICAYHRENDASIIESVLKDNGLKTSFTQGYMLFFYDKDFASPWFRKGVCFGEK